VNKIESDQLDSLVDLLDGRGSDTEYGALHTLHLELGTKLPEFLLRGYKRAKSWKSRSAMVFHAARYARVSQAAIDLALTAVNDKSRVVRYQALLLLAYSLRKDLIAKLEALEPSVSAESSEDLAAAIDAIKQQNQNYFVDRNHSGMVTMTMPDL
jgi:hypothetical protein